MANSQEPDHQSRREHAESEIGSPPIFDAVERGDLDEIACILDRSPEQVDAVDDPDIRMRPLHYTGSAEVAELLLRRGADINARDHEGRTPLHVNAEDGSLTVGRVLVRHGADVRAVDATGRTALVRTACSREPSREIARLLIDHGATLDLRSALSLDRADEARRMLANEPEAVASSSFPEMLLSHAVGLIHRALLNRDDTNYGLLPEPVNKAAVEEVVTAHLDLLDSLIARGTPVAQGFNALETALGLPHPAVAERLLAAGVLTSDPALPGEASTSLLRAAAERSACRDEMFALLRRYGVTR